MSDTNIDTPATDGVYPDGTFSGDERGLRAAAADLADKRVLAEFDAQYSPPPPEIPPAPDGKRIKDDGESPLSSRQAARLLAQQKHDEGVRAAAYREGLSDPASAWAAADGQRTGDSPNVSGDSSRAEGAIDAERAAIEQERQRLAEDRAAQDRFAAMSTAEQQAAAAEQQWGTYEQQLATAIQQGTAEFRQLYADIQTEEDVHRLQQQDPQRFQAFYTAAQTIHNGVQQLQGASQQRAAIAYQRQQVAQQHLAEHTVEFQRVAKDHDAAFERATPELQRDPAKQREVVAALEERFAELGVSPQELVQYWNGQKAFPLRHVAAQQIMLDAAQWRIAQQRLRASEIARRDRPLPPVQRPGVAQQTGSGRDDEIATLHRRASNTSGHKQLQLLARALELKQARQ